MASRWDNFLLTLVPAGLIIGLMWVALRGDGGVVRNAELQDEAHRAHAEWTSLERENTVLHFQLQQLGKDPIHLERMAAEQLHYARPGATLYTFEEPPAVPAAPPAP